MCDQQPAPKGNEPGGPEKDTADSDHTYWLVVYIVWVVFCAKMLLCLYLAYGPDFWREL